MILSILIPTLPKRSQMLLSLISFLEKQKSDGVEILTDNREGITTGRKRKELLQKAVGKFIVFIDDDDEVSDDYIPLIVQTIKNNPDIDCIGIQGKMTTDGKDERQWYISKEFGRWYEKDKVYYRCQNHISPVLREHALKASFDDITYREDYFYSMRLLPLLTKEAKIEKNIYNYKYITKK